MRYCLAAILSYFLLAVAGLPANSGTTKAVGVDIYERIEVRIKKELQENGFPSLAVGIVQGENLVYAKGFGVANRKNKKPSTADTLYRIGSITKVFTATLLVALRDAGLLELDDALSKYIPGNIPVPSDPRGAPEITLRHLATHSSGLPRLPVTLNSQKEDPYDNFPKKELIASLKKTKLDYPTGAKYSYSNLGFALLGYVLEKASGKPYEMLLSSYLFEPLGMNNSTVTLSGKNRNLLAKPYLKSDTQKETFDWKMGSIVPAGGIASSIRDMAKFISLQLKAGTVNKHVIYGGSLLELHTPQRLTNNWNGAVGLGWQVQPSNRHENIVWHNGGMDGFRSYLGFVRERKVGVIVLANCGKSVDELGQWLLEEAVAAYGKETKKPVDPEIEKMAHSLAKYIVDKPAEGLADLFHKKFLKAIPMTSLKPVFSGIYHQHGSCEVTQILVGEKPRSGTILLTCKDGQKVRCHLQTDTSASPKIIYLLFQ